MTHEIIKTDNYLLVVDDSEIKESYWIGYPNLKQFVPVQYLGGDLTGYEKKIIAHLPLHNAPFLEGVDVLPPFDVEDDVEKLAKDFFKPELPYQKKELEWNGFIKGYNKAREKYKYTERQLDAAIDWAIKHGREGDVTITDIDNFIQSLSQPKMPIGFECEYREIYWDGVIEGKQITIINSQGRIQWVGKYIYA